MAIKEVFVTGATGNLGQSVVAELLQRGIEVTALVRKRSKFPFRTLIGNLRSIYVHKAAIAKSDAVVHLASPRGNDPESVLHEDVEGTLQLLCAWSHGPFLYPSSQGIYGVPKRTLVEKEPYDPSCWFDLGRIFNELQIHVRAQNVPNGVGASLRIALLFPTSARAYDRQYIASVLASCDQNRRFLVDSDEGLHNYGSSYIGSTDLGRAFVRGFSLKESGPYNVSGGFFTWRELISTYNRLAGTRASIEVRPNPKAKNVREVRLPQSRSYVDDTLFRKATGYKSRQTLEELIDEWLRAGLSKKKR
jgi:nucleoside-diphosphate-sugar epimerase